MQEKIIDPIEGLPPEGMAEAFWRFVAAWVLMVPGMFLGTVLISFPGPMGLQGAMLYFLPLALMVPAASFCLGDIVNRGHPSELRTKMFLAGAFSFLVNLSGVLLFWFCLLLAYAVPAIFFAIVLRFLDLPAWLPVAFLPALAVLPFLWRQWPVLGLPYQIILRGRNAYWPVQSRWMFPYVHWFALEMTGIPQARRIALPAMGGWLFFLGLLLVAGLAPGHSPLVTICLWTLVLVASPVVVYLSVRQSALLARAYFDAPGMLPRERLSRTIEYETFTLTEPVAESRIDVSKVARYLESLRGGEPVSIPENVRDMAEIIERYVPKGASDFSYYKISGAVEQAAHPFGKTGQGLCFVCMGERFSALYEEVDIGALFLDYPSDGRRLFVVIGKKVGAWTPQMLNRGEEPEMDLGREDRESPQSFVLLLDPGLAKRAGISFVGPFRFESLPEAIASAKAFCREKNMPVMLAKCLESYTLD